MKKLKKNGFTLIEGLLGLFITLIISFCMVVFLKTCLIFIQFRPSHQDQMAILQLRQMVMISKDKEIRDDSLYMMYEHDEISISYQKNRLVRQPGYEIIMEDIEDAYFMEDEEEIYLIYTRENQTKKVQIY